MRVKVKKKWEGISKEGMPREKKVKDKDRKINQKGKLRKNSR